MLKEFNHLEPVEKWFDIAKIMIHLKGNDFRSTTTKHQQPSGDAHETKKKSFHVNVTDIL